MAPDQIRVGRTYRSAQWASPRRVVAINIYPEGPGVEWKASPRVFRKQGSGVAWLAKFAEAAEAEVADD
jgi:hypothetical protein